MTLSPVPRFHKQPLNVGWAPTGPPYTSGALTVCCIMTGGVMWFT